MSVLIVLIVIVGRVTGAARYTLIPVKSDYNTGCPIIPEIAIV